MGAVDRGPAAAAAAAVASAPHGGGSVTKRRRVGDGTTAPTIHGLLGYFTSELYPGIVIDTRRHTETFNSYHWVGLTPTRVPRPYSPPPHQQNTHSHSAVQWRTWPLNLPQTALIGLCWSCANGTTRLTRLTRLTSQPSCAPSSRCRPRPLPPRLANTNTGGFVSAIVWC